jgi:hypothetical protein|tara:strand:+ start:926 stop:2104 length:1179 start_codon:yes stop_codon:yes gene_type:complete
MSELKVNSIKGVGASAAAITVNNTDGTCTANVTNNLSNRNIIINGNMIVSQRNGTTATAVTGTSQYTLDRIKGSNSTDAAFTIAQSSVAPDGFANSLKVDVTTADASLDAGHYGQLVYLVEAQDLQQLAFGTSGAKDCILSFYVRSNKTGNYGVAVLQSDNASKQVSFQYTINSADTWERKSFVIPGDTSGVINNDNGAGFDIHIGLGAGTTYTSGSLRSSFTSFANGDLYAGLGVNLFDSTSNEWYITGIQLEVDHTGSGKPTDFEHRSFNQELDLCKRYFQTVAKGREATGASFEYMGHGYGWGTGQAEFLVRWDKEMRAYPTVDSASGTNYFRMSTSGLNVDFDNWVGYGLGKRSGLIYKGGISSIINGHSFRAQINNNSAYVYLNAEL